MVKFEWRDISSLNTDLFVRAALNQDRAIYFGEIIEAKTKEAKEGKIPREKILEPILVTTTGQVIDGRHRIEGCHPPPGGQNFLLSFSLPPKKGIL